MDQGSLACCVSLSCSSWPSFSHGVLVVRVKREGLSRRPFYSLPFSFSWKLAELVLCIDRDAEGWRLNAALKVMKSLD